MDIISLFLNAVIRAGTPLLFATLGETVTERSGNLNLGVEGMMLMGAVVGYSVGVSTSNPLLAIIAAMIAGAAGALIYSFLTVSLRANQVVTGLTLTIFGIGFSNYLGQNLHGLKLPEAVSSFFSPIKIPLLGDIKYIGYILFHQDILVYLGYIAAIALGIYLYKSRKGLNLRVVGENPAAADASGINVSLYKYLHITFGGALCGLGGAYLSLVYVSSWQNNITSGRGWIAVALVIFTLWNPYIALFGSFFFGGLDIAGLYLQGVKGFGVPSYILDMMPYVVTIIVLIITSAFKIKASAAPKSLGEPYFREDR